MKRITLPKNANTKCNGVKCKGSDTPYIFMGGMVVNQQGYDKLGRPVVICDKCAGRE